jgi:hypothetical protein
VDEGDGLENRFPFGGRGFESLSLRYNGTVPRGGAGVDDRGRLLSG